MKLAMIGLGKMGANMTRRRLQAGHEVIVFDLDPAEVEQAITYGAQPAGSLQDLAILLPQPLFCSGLKYHSGLPSPPAE